MSEQTDNHDAPAQFLSYEGFAVLRNESGRWQSFDLLHRRWVGKTFQYEGSCARYLHGLMRGYREPIMRWILTGNTR